MTNVEENLGEGNIRRRIFFKVTTCHHYYLLSLIYILRDAAPGYHFESNREKVNHLLFMDDLKLYASNEKSFESLILTIRVFGNKIEMEFGVEKCAVLTIMKGKITNSDGIALLNKTTIKELKVDDSYKYLGAIQADGMKHHAMKKKGQNSTIDE